MPEYSSRIHDLAQEERPRERLVKFGPQSLSTAELIAILLRTGVEGENAIRMAERILRGLGGIKGLHQADFSEVVAQHGLGKAKAATIKAAIELGRRLSIESPNDKPVIHSPEDAARLVQYEMRVLEQENLKVMHLNTRNQVESIDTVYQGSINSAQIRISELFKMAVRRNAASIILIHNHPSGDPTPSKEDISVTKRIQDAGELLDIQVLDHLVIGDGKFFSLKEAGFMR